MTASRSPSLLAAVSLALIACTGCVGSAVPGSSGGAALDRQTIHVAGPADSRSSGECFLLLESKVTGGGTMKYCLQKFTGRPGPNAVVRSSGAVTFALPEGVIRSDVDVRQTFGPDGRHADQTLTGKVTGGTGAYAGVNGTISGGGPNEEFPPGHIRDSSLHYLIHLDF